RFRCRGADRLYRDVLLVRAGVDVDLAADSQTSDAGQFDVRVTGERRVEELRGRGRGSDRADGSDLARTCGGHKERLAGGESSDTSDLQIGRTCDDWVHHGRGRPGCG